MSRRSTAARSHHTLALLVAATLGTTMAGAAPSGNQSLALQKFEQGRGEFQANRFADALASFQASAELEPSPNSRLYIARCYRAMGKVGSAYTTYKLAAGEAEDRVRATGEQRYGATRDTATKEADELKPKVPSVTFGVPRDAPPDLTIFLDDAPLNRAAWSASLTVDPGAHTVKATGARVRPFATSITLSLGERKMVDIQAVRMATATLRLSWDTRPSVFAANLDGKSMMPDAFEKPLDLDVGEHTLSVSSPGYKPFVWKQALADGQNADVNVVLVPEAPRESVAISESRGTPPWLFFSTAGASVATLTVGTVMYLSANAIVKDQKNLDPLLREPGEKDDADAKLRVSRVLYVTGGVLAAGTAVLLFTTSWKSPGRSESAVVSPWVGPGGGGITAVGSF